MSKKQEALRRGLRSFIEDTSKELADLEGRPLRHPVDPLREVEPEVAADPIVDVSEAPAADAAPADVEPKSAPRRVVDEEPPPAAVRVTPAPASAPEPSGRPERAATGLEPSASAVPTPEKPPLQSPPGTRSSFAPRIAPPVMRQDTPPSPAPPRGAAPASTPVHAQKPRSRQAVRRRPRPAEEIGADGVNPAQAHARKGVCFAYFLNHDCWRVPDAYCTTALHVCITRECPIYHLHKEALERRFAKKFKHLW